MRLNKGLMSGLQKYHTRLVDVSEVLLSTAKPVAAHSIKHTRRLANFINISARNLKYCTLKYLSTSRGTV